MEVNKSLSDQCKKQLRTTPFGWLLNLHCNIEASGRMLEVMLATWNADKRAFQVGDKLIPFTLYDVALILGLPMTRESIDCNKSYDGGIWACEHLGIGQKYAQINQPFQRFLSWSHQRMFSQKAIAAFNNSDNVLCVLAPMPWEQRESVFQVERTEREALASHIKHLEDELNRVEGILATVMESSPTLPIPTVKTPIVDLPSSPSKAIKKGKPAKKKAKTAMVDLASSPSKRDKRGRPAKNEGEAAAAMVDLASSPSKLAKRGRPAKNEGRGSYGGPG
uniref:Aminotransferase-like plant mobile domain-containing protein n=1 Tax=Fagus sylvatica TaxID=28930 RepID=A0A2N9GDI8_FAGSY